MLVSELLSQRSHDRPDKTALICRDSSLTFAELDRQADQLAFLLKEQGIGKGDGVGIVLPNSLEFGLAYFAILRAGGMAVIMDARLKAPELKAIFLDSGIKALISQRQLFDELNAACRGISLRLLWFGDGSLEEGFLAPVLKREPPGSVSFPPAAETDDAVCLYTSGTTGTPKGVVLTYSNFDHYPRTMQWFFGNNENTVSGLILPMSHISGPIYLNEMVLRGSTVLIFDQVKPSVIFEGIERHRVTYIHGVPTIFQLLLSYPHLSRHDTGSLNMAGMMGTTVPVSVMQNFKKVFPHVTVVQGYGLTETSPLITITPREAADAKMASVGKPVPGVDVKLVDDEGKEVPLGGEGEIITRGPHLMRCYYRQPAATAEKIRNGWLFTGDIGRFDEDGYLYHLGRKDDLVITGGLNVYPAEVENVLRDYPGVSDAAVFGKPDPKRGMVIAAAVIPADGVELDTRALIGYLRTRIADYKVPASISVRTSFPTTSTGKMMRNELARA